jgi:hypothetical protein
MTLTLNQTIDIVTEEDGHCDRCGARGRTKCLSCVLKYLSGSNVGHGGQANLYWCRACLEKHEEVLALMALTGAVR